MTSIERDPKFHQKIAQKILHPTNSKIATRFGTPENSEFSDIEIRLDAFTTISVKITPSPPKGSKLDISPFAEI